MQRSTAMEFTAIAAYTWVVMPIGDACPRRDCGELNICSSRPTGDRWQLQYLRCKNCLATFKTRVELVICLVLGMGPENPIRCFGC